MTTPSAHQVRATLLLMAAGRVLYRETTLEHRAYISHSGRIRVETFAMLRDRGLIALSGRTETGLECWELSELGRAAAEQETP